MTETKAFLPRGLWRIGVLILFTVLLHLLAIHWGEASFNAVKVDAAAAPAISVALLPLPTQPVSLPLASKPKTVASKPKPRPAPAASSPVRALAQQPSAAAVVTPDTAVVEAPAIPVQDGAAAIAAAAAAPAADDKRQGNTEAGTRYKFAPPPPADLEYEALAFFDNLNYHGTSTLGWHNDGSRYSIDGEVYVRMFAKITLLSFTSSGELGAYGVSPELYTEKKRNRPATNTHFNRERNLVSFSSSTASYPRVGGEQDRASIIWQLAAIGRGDSSKFAPGAVIDMFVAGVRDGEVWRMQVVGQEQIRLVDGAHQAWHVVRQPRPGSYDQRLDIWLDPVRQWYPARLRFTETSGDYLELSLSNLKTR